MAEPPEVEQLLETELKTERKQKYYDTYPGPEVDVGFGSYRRQILEMRACKETGHYIAQDNRLLDPLEQHRNECAKYEDKGKVGYKSFYIHDIQKLS